MVISKTPLRISFFGGGTDYPGHYEKHGGAVLSTSIDQYVYITVTRLNPLFEYRLRVAYSKTELIKTVDEVQHPSVKACLSRLGIDEGVEVSVTSDLPARSGLGSSSAFTVGLLHALHGFHGRLVSQQALAREAIHVEQQVIKERVGSQDQVAAAIGGFRRIEFSKNDLFRADPLPILDERKAELSRRFMLFFTGQTRLAESVIDEQCKKTGSNYETLRRMREFVDQGVAILCEPKRSLDEFGALLHESWMLKRTLSSKISNSGIDDAYAAARQAGATGGKLLGAGGGGFLLFDVPPEKQEAVAQVLHPLVRVPFGFDNDGSRLIHCRLPSYA